MNNKWIPVIAIAAFALMVTFCKKEEDKPSSSSPCPTTNACGCSSKNKADCEASTDCCKWTVGQGCGCK